MIQIVQSYLHAASSMIQPLRPNWSTINWKAETWDEDLQSYLRSCNEKLWLETVVIGHFTVLASSGIWLDQGDLIPDHLTVPLTTFVPFVPGVRYNLMPVKMEDFGGVPFNWKRIVHKLYRRIQNGERAHIFCDGGKGRTGTMLASLIAVAESPESAPDPIAEVRRRYFSGAVETAEQGEAIFALRGQSLPKHYYKVLPTQAAIRAAIEARRQAIRDKAQAGHDQVGTPGPSFVRKA
jgi:hypothetical protein